MDYKSTFMKKLTLVLVMFSFLSCSKKEKNFLLPENAKELLAGQSGKTWKIANRYNEGTRMNMAGCFLTYRILYSPDNSFNDNNGEQENCGKSLIGSWEIITYKNEKSYIKWSSDQLLETMNSKKNYKYFKILQLEKDTLRLQYRHKQFSSESTFVDTFVPEHIQVEGRDFHW